MFNGKIIFTKHSKDRYLERRMGKGSGNVYKDMLKELSPLNVRRMITEDDGIIHVFTKANNEFIVKKNEKNEYIVITILRLNISTRNKLIEKLVC